MRFPWVRAKARLSPQIWGQDGLRHGLLESEFSVLGGTIIALGVAKEARRHLASKTRRPGMRCFQIISLISGDRRKTPVASWRGMTKFLALSSESRAWSRMTPYRHAGCRWPRQPELYQSPGSLMDDILIGAESVWIRLTRGGVNEEGIDPRLWRIDYGDHQHLCQLTVGQTPMWKQSLLERIISGNFLPWSAAIRYAESHSVIDLKMSRRRKCFLVPWGPGCSADQTSNVAHKTNRRKLPVCAICSGLDAR